MKSALEASKIRVYIKYGLYVQQTLSVIKRINGMSNKTVYKKMLDILKKKKTVFSKCILIFVEAFKVDTVKKKNDCYKFAFFFFFLLLK